MKKLKKILKAALRVTLAMAGVAGFLVLLVSGVDKTSTMPCSKVLIDIDHETGNFFINENDLLPVLYAHAGETVVGKPANEIDIRSIEESAKSNPFVKQVDVYLNMKGELHLDVAQKRPIIRIINNSSVSYYLDENGEKMPASHNFTSRVAVATGNIEGFGDVSNDTVTLRGIYKIAKFIDSNDFWRAQISQIHVSPSGEMELVPRLGEHSIVFGRAEDIESKFNRLMVFYKEGLKNVGWEQYETINVKYNGQIVAKKY